MSEGDLRITGNGPGARSYEPQLRRDIGRFGLLATSVTSVLGTGLVFAGLNASAVAGPAALLSWVLGGAAILVLAMAHAELSAMFPIPGGTVRFPRLAFGDLAGTAFSWASWLQAAVVVSIEVLVLEEYAAYWWPSLGRAPETGQITVTGYFLAVVLVAVFTVINFLGVRWFARAGGILVLVRLVIPVACLIILLGGMHWGNFTSRGFMPYGPAGVLGGLSGGGVVFAFLGFEQADQLAGEARHPQRDIPFAVIGSVLIGLVVYVLAQMVFIGALPSGKLAGGFASLIPGGSGAPGMAGILGIGWLVVVSRVYVLVAPLGTGLAYSATASRLSLGMARNRYVPALFGRVDRRGIPAAGLITMFVLSSLMALPALNSNSLIGDISNVSVLMYSGIPLALGAMRRQFPDNGNVARPYRLPAAGVLAPAAFIVAGLMNYWSGWASVWRVGIVIAAGCLVTFLTWLLSKSQRPSRITWKSTLWVPVYVLGMGFISWRGTSNTAEGISFGWGIVAVVFSLAIYYWAVGSRLPAAEAELMIRDM